MVLVSTEILRVAGLTGFHTSVIVDDREFFFDREGIMAAPPLWSHIVGRAKSAGPNEGKTQMTPVGMSSNSGKALVEALMYFFEKGTYDIFYKNCNTFSDAALYFLAGQRLDPKYNRIERLITSTNPISTRILNRMFRAFVQHTTGTTVDADIYTTNPEAEGFSVEDVVASIDEAAESDSDDDTDDDDDGAQSDCSADSARSLCCHVTSNRRARESILLAARG